MPVLESFRCESGRIGEFHLSVCILGKERAEEEGVLSKRRE